MTGDTRSYKRNDKKVVVCEECYWKRFLDEGGGTVGYGINCKNNNLIERGE